MLLAKVIGGRFYLSGVGFLNFSIQGHCSQGCDGREGPESVRESFIWSGGESYSALEAKWEWHLWLVCWAAWQGRKG